MSLIIQVSSLARFLSPEPGGSSIAPTPCTSVHTDSKQSAANSARLLATTLCAVRTEDTGGRGVRAGGQGVGSMPTTRESVNESRFFSG